MAPPETRGIAALTEVLSRLATTIEARRNADPATSYVAQLLAGGDPAKAAKKVGEEGLETALAGAGREPEALVKESADLLFHLLVLWAAAGIAPERVAAELTRREGVSGHDEKRARAH
ncbi:MAG: phosphoribosyl-ATP diphosphatase [Alphaproteobacteria bacterium]|nr:phosphoribosyl-ATP diphosphatase [Alphaproteobacteria bacterium]